MKKKSQTPSLFPSKRDLPKPSFNFFFGELTLVSSAYKLKKPVTGWWLTFKYLDQDIQATLPVGETVTVWHSEKQNVYFICKEQPMETDKTVIVRFEAQMDVPSKLKK